MAQNAVSWGRKRHQWRFRRRGGLSSPFGAYAPTRGKETARRGRLARRKLRSTNYGGVFVEKGTEKYTIGTEVGRKCVMFGELSGCQIGLVLGKTRLPDRARTRPRVR